jgi:hypothetical protein
VDVLDFGNYGRNEQHETRVEVTEENITAYEGGSDRTLQKVTEEDIRA